MTPRERIERERNPVPIVPATAAELAAMWPAVEAGLSDWEPQTAEQQARALEIERAYFAAPFTYEEVGDDLWLPRRIVRPSPIPRERALVSR